MYTHASQFPHLAGLSHEQTVAVGRRVYAKHPIYAVIEPAISGFVVVGVVLAGWLLMRMTGIDVDIVIGIGTIVAFALIPLANLLWLNTIQFRVTRDEAMALAAEANKDAGREDRR